MKGKLHHIEIWVADLDQTIKFWGWILEFLGYQIYQKWEKGISFRLGKTYLSFEQVSSVNNDIPYSRMRSGLNHLAFYLDNLDQLHNLVSKLARKNISLLYQDQKQYRYNDKTKVIYIEDPEGFELEFVCK